MSLSYGVKLLRLKENTCSWNWVFNFENGYFLTNHHVIEGCHSIGIRYNNLYGKASN